MCGPTSLAAEPLELFEHPNPRNLVRHDVRNMCHCPGTLNVHTTLQAMAGNPTACHVLGVEPKSRDVRIEKFFKGLLLPLAYTIEGEQPLWLLEATKGEPGPVCVTHCQHCNIARK